jgi:pyruvate carboxylase subunit A
MVAKKPFDKVLVANRGEIALRVMRACRELGIKTVAVYSEADANSVHVRYADEAYLLGPAAPTESYLRLDKIIDIAVKCKADAIHPGYGFLAENPDFPKACESNGIEFIGPPAKAMEVMGSKVEARATMLRSDVPLLPGTGPIEGEQEAVKRAKEIGYPVIIKASGGGGGIGMRIVNNEEELLPAIESCSKAAKSAFGDPTVYMEKYAHNPRHIEVQIIGDKYGNVVYLGERECSIQRRHQKIIEESPSPVVDEELRRQMGEAAVRAAKAVGYYNAGTVEFIYSDGKFYFLEVNARLQVEHPVTEFVTSFDLVKEQISVAAGNPLSFSQKDIVLRGHAIEFRINAEDPKKSFLPAPRKITRFVVPGGPGIRLDTGFVEGSDVPPFYDSLIAKLIVYGRDRAEAIERGKRALMEMQIVGPATTIPYHLAILNSKDFVDGNLSTHFIQDHPELLTEMEKYYQIESPLYLSDVAKKAAAAAAAVNVVISKPTQNPAPENK